MSSAPALNSRYDIIRLRQRFKTHEEDRSRSKVCPATPSRQTRNRRSQRHISQRSRTPQKPGRTAHRCRQVSHSQWNPVLPGDPTTKVPGGKTKVLSYWTITGRQILKILSYWTTTGQQILKISTGRQILSHWTPNHWTTGRQILSHWTQGQDPSPWTKAEQKLSH